SGAGQLARERTRALGHRSAPRQAAAVVGDLFVIELDRPRGLVAESKASRVGLPFPLVTRLQLDLDPWILALGVREAEAVQPPRDLVVTTARKHAHSLALGATGLASEAVSKRNANQGGYRGECLIPPGLHNHRR